MRSTMIVGTSAVAIALGHGARPLAAQREPAPVAPRIEFRLAAPVSPAAGVLGGAGVEIRAGWYARIGAGLVAGAVHSAGSARAYQHAALTARFLFDPFAERPIGLYGGAGLGVGASGGTTSRGELVVVVGVEGAARGRWAPALEAQLGGGLRLQGVLRFRRAVGR